MDNESGMNQLSETLFIPLQVRSREAASANPLFFDDRAGEILRACRGGEDVEDGGPVAVHGILARTVVIDREVRAFLREKPDGVIVNLGAGLDSRASRLDNGRAKWYDVDLPDVIALRGRFFPEDERHRLVAGSVLDDEWIAQIPPAERAGALLIAEGLLMYFSEEEVKAILTRIGDAFPASDLIFDAVNRAFVGKGITAGFRWGLDRVRDARNLAPGARLVAGWPTGSLLRDRQPLWLRALGILPSTRNRSMILRLSWDARETGEGTV